MSKKEYLLKLLPGLQDILPIARDIQILLEGDVVSDELIDSIVTMLQKIVADSKSTTGQDKIHKSIAFLEKLKQIEAQESIRDQAKVQELEQMFKEI